MIFVTVGTSQFPFDRLIAAVDRLAVDDEVVVQRGVSQVVPASARTVDFMTFDELVAHVGRARVVISHAGVGSIMVALGAERRPLVVPRLARYCEAVDDHQLRTARALATSGRVVLVEDIDKLGRLVEEADGEAALPGGTNLLAGALRTYVESVLAPRPASPKRSG